MQALRLPVSLQMNTSWVKKTDALNQIRKPKEKRKITAVENETCAFFGGGHVADVAPQKRKRIAQGNHEPVEALSACEDAGTQIVCLSTNTICVKRRDALNRRAQATVTRILGLRRSTQTGQVPLYKININLVRKTDTLNCCAICNACK